MSSRGFGAPPPPAGGAERKRKPLKKKKSKKEDIEAEDPLTVDQKVIFLTRNVESLRHALVFESNKASQAEAEARDLRQRVCELQKDYLAEKNRTFEVSASMTQQYKAVKDEMLKQIKALEAEKMKLEQNLAQADQEKQRLIAQQQIELKHKDDKIREKTAKMDEMAAEFGKMLKQTLDKMNERIASTNQWDGGSGSASAAASGPDKFGPAVRSLQDFSLLGLQGPKRL